MKNNIVIFCSFIGSNLFGANVYYNPPNHHNDHDQEDNFAGPLYIGPADPFFEPQPYYGGYYGPFGPYNPYFGYGNPYYYGYGEYYGGPYYNHNYYNHHYYHHNHSGNWNNHYEHNHNGGESHSGGHAEGHGH